MYNARKQISGCLGITWRNAREGLQRSTKKLLGVMNLFIIVNMMKISQVYLYVETYQIVSFK